MGKKIFDVVDSSECVFCNKEFDVVYFAEQVTDLQFCPFCGTKKKVSIERIVSLIDDKREQEFYKNIA